MVSSTRLVFQVGLKQTQVLMSLLEKRQTLKESTESAELVVWEVRE